MVEKRKTEAIAVKLHRAKREISLSSEEEDKSNTRDDIDPDKTNDKYPLLLQY